MIVSKIKPFKMNKMEKAAGGVNRTVETATIEVQANHMAREITPTPSHEQQSLLFPSNVQDATLG